MATNREKMKNKLRHYWSVHRCCYYNNEFYSYSQLYNRIGKEATKYVIEGSWSFNEWIESSLTAGRILTEIATKEVKLSLLDELYEIVYELYGGIYEN